MNMDRAYIEPLYLLLFEVLLIKMLFVSLWTPSHEFFFWKGVIISNSLARRIGF